MHHCSPYVCGLPDRGKLTAESLFKQNQNIILSANKTTSYLLTQIIHKMPDSVK